MRFTLLFLAGVAVDLIWAALILFINRGHAIRAAIAQLAFTFIAVGATWSVVGSQSISDLVAYGLGGAAGTWAVVRYDQRR